MARPSSNAMSLYAKDGHKRAARMLGYALTLGTANAWLDAAAVFGARLTAQERAGLAFAALTSLDPETRRTVAEGAFPVATPPQPALISVPEEAALWADMARADELEAFCVAAFLAMPEARQSAFLRFANGRAAA